MGDASLSADAMDELLALLQRYTDHRILPADREGLNRMLRQNAAARRLFVQFCLDAQLINDAAMPSQTESDQLDDLHGSMRRTMCRELDNDVPVLAEALEQERAAKQHRAVQKQHEQTEARDQQRMMQLFLGGAPELTPVRHVVIPRSVFYGGIAAMIAVLVTVLVAVTRQEVPSAPITREMAVEPTVEAAIKPAIPVARLVAQVDAQWEGTSTTSVDGVLYDREYLLAQGVAKLRFNNEAEVILQGPCRFTPESDDTIRLDSGKLAGLCQTPRSKGFLVRTPTAEVRDIGTRFGVAIDWRGATTIHVVEGVVQARSSAGKYRSLHATESASIYSDGRIDPTAYVDDSQFIFSIRSWRYRPEITGAVRWSPELTGPIVSGAIESDVYAHLLLERAGAAISRRPRVAIQSPGTYTIAKDAPFENALLQAERADVYMLHFDPVGSRVRGDILTARGSVTFRRPVLGIEVRSIRYGNNPNAPAEYAPDEPLRLKEGLDDGLLSPLSDVVMLSNDRRTVSFHLNAATGADQMRIFVEPEAAEEADLGETKFQPSSVP